MNASELTHVARAMVAKGKGILAADESTGTIKKRFDGIKLESTEEHRRTYREMLFTAPGAAESDQRRHSLRRDHPPENQGRHAVPGVPDASRASSRASRSTSGAKPLAGFPGETITEGLDGLRERLSSTTSSARASPSGARSSTSATDIPTAFAIEANAHALARYAALCQENGIVPIVEPEVLMDGAHSHRALRGGDRTRVLRDRVSTSCRASHAISRAWCSSPTW